VQVRDFEGGTKAMFIGYFLCFVPKHIRERGDATDFAEGRKSSKNVS